LPTISSIARRMKLELINVQNLCSIREIDIESCGGFNVVIGKNNAGKSNILIAIDAFFRLLSKGEPVMLDSSIPKTVKPYKDSADKPSRITLFFQLSLEEIELLVQEIILEAPQVRNSVDGIGAELRLGVTIEIGVLREHSAYIKNIVLCKPDCLVMSGNGIVHTLLSVSEEAANELVFKAKSSQELEAEATGMASFTADNLKRLDDVDWKKIQSNPSFSKDRLMMPYRMGREKLSDSALKKMESLIQSSSSASDFSDAVSSLVDDLRKEAADLRIEPIKNRIESFSGQETSIPQYALNLIRRIGEINVLYLTERREQIGRREAAQRVFEKG
jgi:putative ATP-dependent endonuclease of the OLD family